MSANIVFIVFYEKNGYKKNRPPFLTKNSLALFEVNITTNYI